MLSYDLIRKIFTYNCPLHKRDIEYSGVFLNSLQKLLSDQIILITRTSKKFNREFKNEKHQLKEYMKKISKIKYFIRKYHVYQSDYEYILSKMKRDPQYLEKFIYLKKFKYNFKAPPFLYDCLSSGCNLPFCRSSQKEIDMKDIKDMIKICPESVHYNMGTARCRDGVRPLWTLRANQNISLDIKAKIYPLLFANGAKMTDIIYVNGGPFTIEYDFNNFM